MILNKNMLPELNKVLNTVDVYYYNLQKLAREFFIMTGWDQCLFDQVYTSLMYQYNHHNCGLYVPFLNILLEGVYTTINPDDFVEFILSSCQDSFSSLRCMCFIMQSSLDKLHTLLAI